MELPDRFSDLPTWAVVLGVLGVLMVALTGLSMVLGVVFAGIAVGIELGSVVVGLLAALVGLLIVLAPVAALVWAVSSDGGADPVGRDDRIPGEHEESVDALRERYVAGEIDEDALERQVDDLLADAGGKPDDPGRESETGVDEMAAERKRKRYDFN